MTVPRGSPATTEINAAVAGMLPVEPATTTGPPGGVRRQASACASSRRRRRSAGPMQPSAVWTAGHSSVSTRRNLSVTCQCAA